MLSIAHIRLKEPKVYRDQVGYLILLFLVQLAVVNTLGVSVMWLRGGLRLGLVVVCEVVGLLHIHGLAGWDNSCRCPCAGSGLF